MNPWRPFDRLDLKRQLGTPRAETDHSKDRITMLMYEDLARARMREAERSAAALRLAYRLRSARRWRRVERWAGKRASRYADTG